MGRGRTDGVEHEVDRAVERVQEPEPQQGVGHVGHDGRQVGRGAVRPDAAEARVQQQREEEGAREPSGTANAANSSELRSAAAKISSVPVARGSSRARATRAGARGPTRRTPSPNVTSAGSGDERDEPEDVRREHEREHAALAVAGHSAPPRVPRRRGGRARGGARGQRCRPARRGSRRRRGRPRGARRRGDGDTSSLPASSTTSTCARISPPSATCSGRIPASSGTAARPHVEAGTAPHVRPRRRQMFIAGRADEGRDEAVRGSAVDVERRSDLLEHGRRLSTATRLPSVSASTWSCVT